MHNADMQVLQDHVNLVCIPHQDPAYMRQDPVHNHCCMCNPDRNRRT